MIIALFYQSFFGFGGFWKSAFLGVNWMQRYLSPRRFGVSGAACFARSFRLFEAAAYDILYPLLQVDFEPPSKDVTAQGVTEENNES